MLSNFLIKAPTPQNGQIYIFHIVTELNFVPAAKKSCLELLRILSRKLSV